MSFERGKVSDLKKRTELEMRVAALFALVNEAKEEILKFERESKGKWSTEIMKGVAQKNSTVDALDFRLKQLEKLLSDKKIANDVIDAKVIEIEDQAKKFEVSSTAAKMAEFRNKLKEQSNHALSGAKHALLYGADRKPKVDEKPITPTPTNKNG